jgi:hypothetical protein
MDVGMTEPLTSTMSYSYELAVGMDVGMTEPLTSTMSYSYELAVGMLLLHIHLVDFLHARSYQKG